MTNFYEELKLDTNASASEISAELVRLESVWHKREMSRPELAAEKLALIVQAKKIFATDASKAQYDRELNAPVKESAPDDPDAARKAQFQKWYNDAINYYSAGQTDLAKTAIERAAGYGADLSEKRRPDHGTEPNQPGYRQRRRCAGVLSGKGLCSGSNAAPGLSQ